MSEEQKTSNVEAEKDVQDVLAELKGENGTPAEKTAEKTDKEDPEEARIVAGAAKLGEKSEQSEEKSQQEKSQRDSHPAQRGDRFSRNKAKFDPSSQKETDDPVEIRKQV